MQNNMLYINNRAITKIPTKLNEVATMIIDKMKILLNAPS